MNLLISLRHGGFASLWVGQTISRIGDHLYEVALAWWVLQKTGSALQMGTVLICSFLPMVLFLLIGGVVVDRFGRGKVMLISDLVRGVVVGLIAMAAYAGRLELWHVYAGSAIFGVADAFFQPAYSAVVPQIVIADSLPSANSVTSLSVQVGRIAGPALGAAIISVGGTSLAFALNATSFFISALFLLPLASLPTQPRDQTVEQPSMLADLREAWGFVISLPWLWITIAVLSVTNVTLAGPYSVALPFLVKDVLHRDVATLGVLYSIFPIGYVLAAVVLGSGKRLARPGVLIYIGMGLAGAMILLFGLRVSVVVMGVAAFINGAALEAASLTWIHTLQQKVKPDMLGRVSSIDAVGSYALLPMGYAITGIATDHFGAAAVFALGGALTAILSLAAIFHPSIRNLR